MSTKFKRWKGSFKVARGDGARPWRPQRPRAFRDFREGRAEENEQKKKKKKKKKKARPPPDQGHFGGKQQK
jgi:hypothetical protein